MNQERERERKADNVRGCFLFDVDRALGRRDDVAYTGAVPDEDDPE